MVGKDSTTLDGLGPYLSLKLIAEGGDDLSSWRSAKHFTSWLGLAPNNKVSGGRMLSSRTRRAGGRTSAHCCRDAGRTDTALGAFYRRLSSRIGKAKAVTAAAARSQFCSTTLCDADGLCHQGPRPTRRVTQREWSTIRMGVPRHCALLSNPWSSKSVLPFLRNHSPASIPRSLH
ncbi:IS110 family transposase [Bradyrhizobium sp. 87]|uniref:IS110 family transposase n=1 Tax=Bradyrhizobium sp. 87 TaxID=2782682 RepID=UPI001FF85D0D|nr:IS110 family transposase [Bradyrhizobium sp. 87]MCK1427219.1 transposase [Bradyrhizobium sp. 87]